MRSKRRARRRRKRRARDVGVAGEAIAERDVRLVRRDDARDGEHVLGAVLAVGVHRDEGVERLLRETSVEREPARGLDRSALPEIDFVPREDDLECRGGEDLRRHRLGASIVDDEDGEVDVRGDLSELGDGLSEAFSLAKCRHEDGDAHRAAMLVQAPLALLGNRGTLAQTSRGR
jgi:hypothetical protein